MTKITKKNQQFHFKITTKTTLTTTTITTITVSSQKRNLFEEDIDNYSQNNDNQQ